MQSADLTLTLPESMQLPVPDWVDDDVVDREEVLSWQVRPAEDAVYFLSLVAGDPEPIREIGAATDVVRTADVTPVDGADACYVYAELPLRDADTAFMSTFDGPGLVVVPPIVYTATDTVRVTVLGEDDALARVLDAVPAGVDATVDRVSEHGRLGGALAARLTRRQFQAIAVARDAGYYEVPRDGDLATVADELDVSQSAASTLLRNAERALVNAALGR